MLSITLQLNLPQGRPSLGPRAASFVLHLHMYSVYLLLPADAAGTGRTGGAGAG